MMMAVAVFHLLASASEVDLLRFAKKLNVSLKRLNEELDLLLLSTWLRSACSEWEL